jgi:hypothetical protein
MFQQPDAILPILDETISCLEEALQSKQADDQTISKLTESIQQLKRSQDRVVLEKVAEARRNFLDEGIMGEALVRLQGMRVIDSAISEKLASRFKTDPNTVFPVMVKLAEKLQSAPGDGAGVDKEASSEDEDPDGWKALVEGREVRIKR